MEEIQTHLRQLQDIAYRDFQKGLILGTENKTFIGVRTPALRAYAKQLMKCEPDLARKFMEELPHAWFDEDQLHAFLLSEIKDFDECMEETEEFLPYVDNWATCDQLSPKVFGKNKERLLAHIDRWLESDHVYAVRFGIGMLMSHFLGEDFDGRYMEKVARVSCEGYYVDMMVAWYFATALAKQYEAAIVYLEEKRLSRQVHNKTIQKAVESRRIDNETKTYLKTLKLKGNENGTN